MCWINPRSLETSPLGSSISHTVATVLCAAQRRFLALHEYQSRGVWPGTMRLGIAELDSQQVVYRREHLIDASRTRGRVHGFNWRVSFIGRIEAQGACHKSNTGGKIYFLRQRLPPIIVGDESA